MSKYLKRPKKPRKLKTQSEDKFFVRYIHYQEQIKIWRKEYHIIRKKLDPNYNKISPEKKKVNSSKYRKNNSDTIKAYKDNWYRENSERLKAKAKLNRENNPDYNRNWKLKNPDKVKQVNVDNYRKVKADPELSEIRKHRDSNYYHTRKLNDIQYIARRSLRGSLNTKLRFYNINKKDSVFNLIGCTIEEFIEHISEQFAEGMTWTPKNFHLDHIKPCSHFDLTDSEQAKVCFHYSNFQPLWPKDNLSKGAKINWKKSETRVDTA